MTPEQQDTLIGFAQQRDAVLLEVSNATKEYEQIVVKNKELSQSNSEVAAEVERLKNEIEILEMSTKDITVDLAKDEMLARNKLSIIYQELANAETMYAYIPKMFTDVKKQVAAMSEHLVKSKLEIDEINKETYAASISIRNTASEILETNTKLVNVTVNGIDKILAIEKVQADEKAYLGTLSANIESQKVVLAGISAAVNKEKQELDKLKNK